MALLTQSYVHGASSTTLIGETIGENLRRVTAEHRTCPAHLTRHQDVRWSGRGLLRRSEDLAISVRKLVSKKATGSASGRPTRASGFWPVWHGAGRIILVNINPAYRAHEFDHAIQKSSCRAVILSSGPQE